MGNKRMHIEMDIEPNELNALIKDYQTIKRLGEAGLYFEEIDSLIESMFPINKWIGWGSDGELPDNLAKFDHWVCSARIEDIKNALFSEEWKPD